MSELPIKIAKCYGIATATGWRKDCKDCLRRTATPRNHFIRVTPSDIEGDECPLYIKPKEAP